MLASSLVRIADVAPPGPFEDRGSRWVYLAAVLGLIVGGIIAYKRRKV